jgi:hypothetical protein
MSKLLNDLFKEFANREERGLKKYGTTMDRNDLSLNEWIQHFKEELMDGLLYLQKIQNDTQKHTHSKEEDSRNTKRVTSN